MDKAKLRLIAGGAAALFGLAGVVAVGVGITLALAAALGAVAATFVAGAMYLAIAGIAVVVFVIPGKPVEKEVSQLEETAAGALADLPFDTLKALVDKRPLTTALGAAFVTYMVVREPKETFRTAQRILPFLL